MNPWPDYKNNINAVQAKNKLLDAGLQVRAYEVELKNQQH
jgi:hypothetical protein